MVTYVNTRSTASGLRIEGVCLTTDDKPVQGIANGSTLKELNASTGAVKEYIFNADGPAWVEITSEAGSGGSGGDANIIVCYPEVDLDTGDTKLVLSDGSYLTYNTITNSGAALIMLIDAQENEVGYYPLTTASHEEDGETGEPIYSAYFRRNDIGKVALAGYPDDYLVISN